MNSSTIKKFKDLITSKYFNVSFNEKGDNMGNIRVWFTGSIKPYNSTASPSYDGSLDIIESPLIRGSVFFLANSDDLRFDYAQMLFEECIEVIAKDHSGKV
jgi:hypothetical protein